MDNPEPSAGGDNDGAEEKLDRFVLPGSNFIVGRSSGSSVNKVERVELTDSARLMFGQFVARKVLGNQNEINVERIAKYNERARNEYNILLNNRHTNLVEVIARSLEVSDPNSPLAERHLPRFYMKLADYSLRYAISRLDAFPTVISYTVDHVTSWLLQAANGLAFLHSRDIVHRDMKALNMLLYQRGVLLKLCDLEIGRDCQINMTAEQGTDLWKAPEVKIVVGVDPNQQDKQLATYGKPADCYSFGRVILELLLRNLPPPADTEVDWENSILMDAWPTQKHKETLLKLQLLQSQTANPNPNDRPPIEEIVNHLRGLDGRDNAPALDSVSIPVDDCTDTGAQWSLMLQAGRVQPPALPAELLDADVALQQEFLLSYNDDRLTDEQLNYAVSFLNEKEHDILAILSTDAQRPLTVNMVSVTSRLSVNRDSCIELCIKSPRGANDINLVFDDRLVQFLSDPNFATLLLGLLSTPLYCSHQLMPRFLSLSPVTPR